jgi:hypothetical protein
LGGGLLRQGRSSFSGFSTENSLIELQGRRENFKDRWAVSLGVLLMEKLTRQKDCR